MSRILLAAAVAACALLPSTAGAAALYSVTNLGEIPGGINRSIGYGLSDNGQATGLAGVTGGNDAFRWNGTMQDLGDLPGGNVWAEGHGINNAGTAVGFSSTTVNGSTRDRAFRSTGGGTVQDLGSLGGGAYYSRAFAINEAGYIVGESGAPSPVDVGHAVIWGPDGSITDLGDLPGGSDRSVAYGINNSNQVAGTGYASTGAMAFRYSGGTMQALGDLAGGAVWSEALAINDLGQVTGFSHVTSSGNYHAYLWTEGVMQDLGALATGSNYSKGYGVNEAGQVVGISGLGGDERAFLWSQATGMQNLNDLIDPSGGWVLYGAYAVNSQGQILARARNGNGTGFERAVILNPLAAPVPEPATWAMMIAGFGAVGGAMRRRTRQVVATA